MKSLLFLFISFLFYGSSKQQQFGYCDTTDADCMNAWTKCHGEKLTGSDLLILKAFWGGKVQVVNICLQKFGIEPLNITFPEEDPDGGAPGGPEQYEGLFGILIKKIKDPEVAVKIKCCYADGSEFLDAGRNVNETTFTSLIHQRFHKEPLVLGSLLKSLQSCKTTPITDCDMIPFRDCMYKSCIAEIQPQLALEKKP